MTSSDLHEQHNSQPLKCVMPWKALYMDEYQGQIVALPCCLSWIRRNYGRVGSARLQDLWNSPEAQNIRRLLSSGRQHEVCQPNCPYFISGDYGEGALRIIDGPSEFVANQELNLQEIRERRTVLRSQPMLLKVVPTLQCNLRCTMCFQKHPKSADITKECWKEIEQLLPYAREIIFQGGEVTIHQRLNDFLESELQLHLPQLRISLITNGTMLDTAFLQKLSRVKINSIIVSLNAATKETYAHITGKDMFDSVLQNLYKLIELSSKHLLGSFEIFLSFVVMRSNYRELPIFLRLANQLGMEVKLLEVIGNRNGEDIFVRRDRHLDLQKVLEEAASITCGEARVQVERIHDILRVNQIAF